MDAYRTETVKPRTLVIRITEGIDAASQLAADWDTLIPNSAAAVFCGLPWYQAWSDAFHPRDVAIVTARCGEEIVGLLPLARIRTDARGLYFPLVVPFALGDYQPFLVKPESLSNALPAMLDAAADHYGRRSVYWWPHLPEDDPSYETLKLYMANRGMHYVEERESAPRLCIGGAGLAAVEAGLAAKLRKDVRRQRKRLAEEGPVSLWQPGTLDEAIPALHEFFDVHDSKWLAQGYPGIFRNQRSRAHFEAMLRRLWGRGLHFSALRCGDVNVSFHFGFLSGNWLLWYRPSYRHEYGRFSPSKIHVSMLIEDACRLEWEGLDFLLGDEPYKYQWSNAERQVVSIHSSYRSFAPAYLWFSRGKPFVRRKLLNSYVKFQTWRQKRSAAS